MSIVNTGRLNTFWREGILPIKQGVTAHTLTITQLQEAVGAEQDNIDMLEAAVSALQNGGSGAGGILSVYIRENTNALSNSWLSEEEDGDALTPQNNILYVIMTEGDYYKKLYRYNSSTTSYELVTINTDVMTGATSSADGASGVVPAPTSSDKDKFLKGDGTWSEASGGGGSRTTTTTILSASNWSNSQYSLESLYSSDDYDIEVAPYSVMTSAQLEAWSSAKPVGSSESNIIVATGDVPSIDIPVMVIAVKK